MEESGVIGREENSAQRFKEKERKNSENSKGNRQYAIEN